MLLKLSIGYCDFWPKSYTETNNNANSHRPILDSGLRAFIFPPLFILRLIYARIKEAADASNHEQFK